MGVSSLYRSLSKLQEDKSIKAEICKRIDKKGVFKRWWYYDSKEP